MATTNQTHQPPKNAPQTQAPAQPATARGKAGQPVSAEERLKRAKDALQGSLDRTNQAIHDSPTASFAKRVKSAARAGIPKDVVLRAYKSMEDAMADLRKVIDRAYDHPDEKRPTTVSRINL